MSYSIRHVEADRWTVINDDDVTVFTGSLRDCEDWLDSWENASRPRRSPLRMLFAPIRRLFGVPPDAAPPHAAQKPEQPSRGMDAERGDVPHSQASRRGLFRLPPSAFLQRIACSRKQVRPSSTVHPASSRLPPADDQVPAASSHPKERPP